MHTYSVICFLPRIYYLRLNVLIARCGTEIDCGLLSRIFWVYLLTSTFYYTDRFRQLVCPWVRLSTLYSCVQSLDHDIWDIWMKFSTMSRLGLRTNHDENGSDRTTVTTTSGIMPCFEKFVIWVTVRRGRLFNDGSYPFVVFSIAFINQVVLAHHVS